MDDDDHTRRNGRLNYAAIIYEINWGVGWRMEDEICDFMSIFGGFWCCSTAGSMLSHSIREYTLKKLVLSNILSHSSFGAN
jgi:hypothetical protein